MQTIDPARLARRSSTVRLQATFRTVKRSVTTFMRRVRFRRRHKRELTYRNAVHISQTSRAVEEDGSSSDGEQDGEQSSSDDEQPERRVTTVGGTSVGSGDQPVVEHGKKVTDEASASGDGNANLVGQIRLEVPRPIVIGGVSRRDRFVPKWSIRRPQRSPARHASQSAIYMKLRSREIRQHVPADAVHSEWRTELGKRSEMLETMMVVTESCNLDVELWCVAAHVLDHCLCCPWTLTEQRPSIWELGVACLLAVTQLVDCSDFDRLRLREQIVGSFADHCDLQSDELATLATQVSVFMQKRAASVDQLVTVYDFLLRMPLQPAMQRCVLYLCTCAMAKRDKFGRFLPSHVAFAAALVTFFGASLNVNARLALASKLHLVFRDCEFYLPTLFYCVVDMHELHCELAARCDNVNDTHCARLNTILNYDPGFSVNALSTGDLEGALIDFFCVFETIDLEQIHDAVFYTLSVRQLNNWAVNGGAVPHDFHCTCLSCRWSKMHVKLHNFGLRLKCELVQPL